MQDFLPGLDPDATSWHLIRGAADGADGERDLFAHTYGPVVSAFLGTRWRGTPLAGEVDDAAQEVFLECFRDGGALERVRPGGGPGGFRAYLMALVRNVALRFEERDARRRVENAGSGHVFAAEHCDEAHLSTLFDRAWAFALLDQAVALHEHRAREADPPTLRRVELLRLRFRENLRIRDIAERWGEPTELVHREYAAARHDFLKALRSVVAFHYPGEADAFNRILDQLRDQLG